MIERESSPEARRLPLMNEMQALGARGVHCGTCVGTCCTFVANSMRISPEEALDLVTYLHGMGQSKASLTQSMLDTVTRFGLDRPVLGTGSRELSRRRYTCPFYDGGRLGCTVARDHKPYGCLAFNPRKAGIQDGEDCGSDDLLLEDRRRLAVSVTRDPRFAWDKLPIPLAVLAVLAKMP